MTHMLDQRLSGALPSVHAGIRSSQPKPGLLAFSLLFAGPFFSLLSEEKAWNFPTQLPVNLLEELDNDGIAESDNLRDGNFDCPDHPEGVPGSSYPGELLPKTGAAFQVDAHPEVVFLFPSKAPGEFNNVSCNGQYLEFEVGRFRAVYLLGSSENGDFSDTFHLNYNEGPAEKELGFSDWCNEASFGEKTGFKFPFRYAMFPEGVEQEGISCRLWVQKMPLDPAKTLSGITLPYQRRMHIFAITLLTAEKKREFNEESEEVAQLYLSLRTKKAVFADSLRGQLDPLRAKLTAAEKPADRFTRELNWLKALLDYADYRLPEGNGRVPTRVVKMVKQTVKSVRQSLPQIVKGGNPYKGKRGRLLKSYYSALDDSWQTYALSVPFDYKGDKPFPLMVQLHGHGWYRPFQGYPTYLTNGVFIAAPQGRGSIDYMQSGEDDVLRVIEEIQKDYRIDPNRIILEGHSMGGTGSWQLGGKFPDRFSCIAPVAGNTDHSVYYIDRPRQKTPPEEFRELFNYLLTVNDPITYAENMGGLPVYCVHGAQDTVVRVGHPRGMIDRLRAIGKKPTYKEFKEIRHWGFPMELYRDRWKWMFDQRHDKRPRSMRYKTSRLRHPGAYWIRILQFEKWGKLAEVRAEQTDRQNICIQSENVSELTILTERLFELPDTKLSVLIDDDHAFEGKPAGEIRLAKIEGRWQEAVEREGLRKRKNLEGPISNAFLSPFMIVYGTKSGDPLWNRILKAEAEAIWNDWEQMYRTYPRIKADTEVTGEDIGQFNLILYGGPEHNSVTGRMASKLPVEFNRGSIQFAGRRFTGKGLGVKLCYPNPLNPQRLMVLSASIEPRGIWQLNNRFGNWTGWGPFDNWSWFDFAVFDQKSHDPQTMLCCGFFGPQWNLDPASTWFGNRDSRKESYARQFPPRSELTDKPPDRLWLSELLPIVTEQHKGTAKFDRSYEGNVLRLRTRPYERGFGVRAPSAMEFSLKGKFSRLRTEYGIDFEGADKVTGERAKAEWLQFRVFGDERRLWSSEWIDWKANTAPVEIDISDVDVLRLEVDGGGRRWLFGSASWGNVQLFR